MFSVEIRSHSCGTGAMPWVDHSGHPIDRLVFSKQYSGQYTPGHYPLESFGSLYRTIDDFKQSPLQCLADWKIRIPSVYSSEAGAFQTVDLFYFLECANEDFNLIGCEAVLLEGGQPVFKGAVNSIASGTGGTTISIGESIGSPEIKKNDLPLVLGNASLQYWPVKITENEMGHDVIVISDRMLDKWNGFHMYLGEKHATKFAPANISGLSDEWKINFSPGHTSATIMSRSSVLALEHDIEIGAPFAISSNNAMGSLRPAVSKETPDDCVVGEDGNLEYLQAWSSRLGVTGFYSLGRDIPSRQRHHCAGEEIRRVERLKTLEVYAYITYVPESLVINEPHANPDEFPCTSGNPSAFLQTSKDPGRGEVGPISEDTHPRFFFTGYKNTELATFVVGFPELDLPGSATFIEVSCHVRFCFEGQVALGTLSNPLMGWRSLTGLWVRIEIGGTTKNFEPVSKSDALGGKTFFMHFSSTKSVSDLRKMKLSFYYPNSRINGNVTLGGVRLYFNAYMPLGECKLYASGVIAGTAGSADSSSGESIIPSVEGLLEAAQVKGYSVRAIGELNNVEYGSIVSNEAVQFRDKLRELAAESATLVKFAPDKKEFLVKSVSRQFSHEVALIPLDAIVLENGMYSFNMESSHRNDILDGILLSWGKNQETGKYEHSLSVDLRGLFRDGERWDMRGSMLGDKWLPVIEQLKKNGGSNTKSMDCKWVMDWAGAELMAYNCLCWNCAPLRKAQVKCIIPVLRELAADIGDFIHLDLPGYPPKLTNTAWVITGRHDDLDKMASTLELLEAWNMPVISPYRFLLLENGGNILTEAEQNIKLESLYG
jgi:hypothetical protein